ncbi:MAG: hypothetical protein QXT21_00515 [Thermoplasmata archaeon]
MEITLKVRSEIIKDYINGLSLENISKNYSLSLENVKKIIDEWMKGYFQIGEDDYFIKQIVLLLKEKNITLEELSLGYYYYTLLKNLDKEKTLKFIISLKNMDEQERKSLIENALKMMKLKNYLNIDYSEIPAALDRLVYKAKEIKDNMDNMAKEISNMEEKRILIQKQYELIENELKNREKYLEIVKSIEEKLHLQRDDALNFIIEAEYLNFDGKKMKELVQSMNLLREKNLSTEQFLRVTDYLNKLMEMGFTISLLKDLQNDLEKENVKIQKYIKEMDLYIKNKLEYEKNVEELKKEKKSLENEIRSLRNEIREYFKKIKPKMK